ncbi:ABC transporter ATP-binding protein [Sulfuriferula sp. AH1]|uniref:ABC transporter ATP-binding protein n=1 Tax=Sulfuriferula sp. AH1 TaxID=1985873 RepID=UPI000B3B1347|nr:ABC transporter ATP-binding protein [Sulfuriferula sp. AH1]ARU30296.1 ABC transporter ATP-binding protein [Sulfuriferula sp. AH1]
MSALLNVHDLRVAYGQIHAVQGISLNVAEGERVCLIGANGAGKTTLLKAIAGMLPSAGGSVHFAGQAITHKPSHQIVPLGIALVPEGRGIFSRLSVAENLEMGAYIRRDSAAVKQEIDTIYQRYPRLGERRAQPAGQLSGGEQQLLAINRALLSRPRLLLLDEPSMGLAPLMVNAIFATLQDAHRQGVALLLVEQNARLALAHSDRGYILETGKISRHDSATQLAANTDIKKAYFGE